MQTPLVTGNVEAIRALLAKATLKDGYYVWALDCSEVDALRAECEQERSKYLNSLDRDAVLCRYQVREYSLGARTYALGSNIYGYSVGDSLASNLGGGRWACTPRGYSLEQAIAWGAEKALSRKNTRFEVSEARIEAAVTSAQQA